MKKKIFYLCRRGTQTHLQFYSGWVKSAINKNLPIFLITTVSFREFRNLPKNLNVKELIFIPCWKFLSEFVIILYLIFQFLSNDFILIHLKKQNPKKFDILKKIFKNFRYLIENEGDFESEMKFLLKHPYKKNFYKNDINNLKRNLINENKILDNADHVLCVTENLKQNYIKKYQINPQKITALTTGVNASIFNYNLKKRMKWRKKLNLTNEFTFIYIGNIYYSWQNISLTLKKFLIAKKIVKKAKLIIITRRVDKNILVFFLKKYCIDTNDLLIFYSISNQNIPNFLNIADMGIVLRHNHQMNHMAAPGKFGEYACCGLPILTGVGIANFSAKLKNKGFGIVLENIEDDSEFKKKFQSFLEKKIDRKEISIWGEKNFSFNAYIDIYTQLLRKFLHLLEKKKSVSNWDEWRQKRSKYLK